MTIQLLHYYNGLAPGVHNLGGAEETRLIGLGLARNYTIGMDGANTDLTDAQEVAARGLVSGGGNTPALLTRNSFVLFGDSETMLNQVHATFTPASLTQSGGVATLAGVTLHNGQLVKVSRTGDGQAGGYNGAKRVTVAGGNTTFSVPTTAPATSAPESGYASGIVSYVTVDSDRGWFHYANVRMKQALALRSVSAVNGYRTTHLLALFDDASLGVSTFSAQYCTVFIGINDLLAGSTAATVIANLAQIYDRVLAQGMTVCAFTLTPLASPHGSFGNTTIEQGIFAVNRYIRERCRTTERMHLVDAFDAVVDPISASLSMLSGYSNPADGIHYSPRGGRAIGDAFFNVLNNLALPPRITTVGHISDAFAASSSNTQVLVNPLLTGTAGTRTVGTSSTFTGSVADGWTSIWSGNAAGGCVHTKEARTIAADGDIAGFNQVFAVTFAASGDSVQFNQTSVHARVAAGDEIYMEAFVQVSNCVNFDGISMYFTVGDGVSSYNAAQTFNASGEGPWSQDSLSGVFRTPPFRVPVGFTSCTPRFLIKGAGAGSVTVKIGRVSLIKGATGAFGA